MWLETSTNETQTPLPEDVVAVWRKGERALLTCRTGNGSTLWTLHNADGTPIISQLEMPFDTTRMAPPFNWADTELKRKRDR